MHRLSFTALCGLLLAVPGLAQAQVKKIDFNDVLPGTVVNTAYQNLGITFQAQNQGGFFSQIIADNPGFPANPDPANNALVGLDTPICVLFDSTVYPKGTQFLFDVVADPMGGGLSDAPVSFFDNQGTLLGTMTIDQTHSGWYFAPFSGIQKVLLAGDGYYDNLAAVPEPGNLALMGMGVIFLAGYGLRHKVRR